MANALAPKGFQPSGQFSPTLGEGLQWYKGSATTALIGRYQPVKIAEGNQVSAAATTDTNIGGVLMAVKYILNGQNHEEKYWNGPITGATDVEFLVAHDPHLLFEAQCDAEFELVDLQKNVNFNVGTTDTDTGISGASIDISSAGTEATKPFRIIGVSTKPNPQENEVGNYTVVEGFWNVHVYKGSGGN